MGYPVPNVILQVIGKLFKLYKTKDFFELVHQHVKPLYENKTYADAIANIYAELGQINLLSLFNISLRGVGEIAEIALIFCYVDPMLKAIQQFSKQISGLVTESHLSLARQIEVLSNNVQQKFNQLSYGINAIHTRLQQIEELLLLPENRLAKIQNSIDGNALGKVSDNITSNMQSIETETTLLHYKEFLESPTMAKKFLSPEKLTHFFSLLNTFAEQAQDDNFNGSHYSHILESAELIEQGNYIDLIGTLAKKINPQSTIPNFRLFFHIAHITTTAMIAIEQHATDNAFQNTSPINKVLAKYLKNICGIGENLQKLFTQLRRTNDLWLFHLLQELRNDYIELTQQVAKAVEERQKISLDEMNKNFKCFSENTKKTADIACLTILNNLEIDLIGTHKFYLTGLFTQALSEISDFSPSLCAFQEGNAFAVYNVIPTPVLKVAFFMTFPVSSLSFSALTMLVEWYSISTVTQISLQEHLNKKFEKFKYFSDKRDLCIVFNVKENKLEVEFFNKTENKNIQNIKSPIKIIREELPTSNFQLYLLDSTQKLTEENIAKLATIQPVFSNASQKAKYDQIIKELLKNYLAYFNEKSSKEPPVPFQQHKTKSDILVFPQNPTLVPLFFPTEYFNTLKNNETVMLLMNIAQLEAFAPFYEYSFEKQNNTYKLSLVFNLVVKQQTSYQPTKLACLQVLVATFDALTVESFKKIGFTPDSYSFKINLNEFLILTMYGAGENNPENKIGLASNASCDLTGSGAIFPVDLPFVGLYAILTKIKQQTFVYDHVNYNKTTQQSLNDFANNGHTATPLFFTELSVNLLTGFAEVLLLTMEHKKTEAHLICKLLQTDSKFNFALTKFSQDYATLVAILKSFANVDYYYVVGLIRDKFNIYHPDLFKTLLENDLEEITHLPPALSDDVLKTKAEDLLNNLVHMKSPLLRDLEKILKQLKYWTDHVQTPNFGTITNSQQPQLKPFQRWDSPKDNTRATLTREIINYQTKPWYTFFASATTATVQTQTLPTQTSLLFANQ